MLRLSQPSLSRRALMLSALVLSAAAAIPARAADQAPPLVDADWLAQRLKTPNLVIVDLRSDVDGGGRKAYEAAHIPGAIHSDYLNAGWRQTRNNIPGLLSDKTTLERLFGDLGLEPDSHVVLVPAGVHATDFGSATRAYWTLRVAGHSKISILNGGMTGWQEGGARPVIAGPSPTPSQSLYDVSLNADLHADLPEVEQLVATRSATLVDARPAEFYTGKERSPQAQAFGRLPGAINVDSFATYDAARNRLRSIDELRALFAKVPASGPVVTYCNSGQWSATEWFILAELLGRKDVKMYPGSMVEWTASPSRPIESDRKRWDDLKARFGG